MMKRVLALLKRLHENDESGAAMVEFSIVFPVQFFLTLAVMQLSLIFVGHMLVQHAAFGAARAALVADVPRSASDTGDAKTRIEQQAKRAACYVLSPTGASDDEAGSSSAPGDAIPIGNSKGAFAYTNVELYPKDPANDSSNFIGVRVEHDYRLIIPLINKWFAGNGPLGEFWYGKQSSVAFNSESQQRGYPVIRIKKDGFMPRPWKVK